eukprot:m.106761 g.106761  ORF g.106761 m.106761 type:complete len:200 (+) comp9193_c0_seq1:4380-4979(+)
MGHEYTGDALHNLLPAVSEGHVRLYHATSVNSVSNIVRNGINAAYFKDTCDFGKGFYMTPEIDCAMHFLLVEAPPAPHHHPRALLVLDIDAEGLHNLPEVPELRQDGDVWAAVVSSTDSTNESDALSSLSRATRTELREAGKLVGPLTTRQRGRRFLGPSEEPWQQFCFRDVERIDPCRFLGGLDDTLVHAAHVVRFLE